MHAQFWKVILPAFLVGLFILNGCDTASPKTVAGVNDQPLAGEATSAVETPTKRASDTTTITPAATPVGATAATGSQLPDEVVADLLDPDGPTAAAIETLLEAGDQRFVSVLLELMRARQIGLIEGSYSDIVDALEELSGQNFGDDWPAWVAWYGQTDLIPPPGFTGWKGQLLSTIDPGFADFLRDEFPSRIRTKRSYGAACLSTVFHPWKTRP